MTERLYYHDPYLREFDALVTRALDVDGRPAVLLDRTAFYPTAGGQPFDVGTLGAARVVDVIDSDDEEIVHVLDRRIDEGERVRGVLDWERRFDHMQQHTGQHVLSAAFDALLSARTESFHLGAESATIDLAKVVTVEQIARAESAANAVVWEDRAVSIRFVDAVDAARLPLRKESLRTGTLRLIEVEAFDISACGGTHVSRTGAIGLIAVSGTEKVRGGTRVEFVCGGRALAKFRLAQNAAAGAARTLSVLPAELPAAIDRLQSDLKTASKTIRDLQLRLAEHEAARLAQNPGAVVEVLEGWGQDGLKAIASAVARRPGAAAVLLSAPAPSAIVIARAPDAAIDAAGVLKKLIERFGGKGGGRSDLAQGGGLLGDPAEIAAAARESLAGQP